MPSGNIRCVLLFCWLSQSHFSVILYQQISNAPVIELKSSWSVNRALGTKMLLPNSSPPHTSSAGKPHVMTVWVATRHWPIFFTKDSASQTFLRQCFYWQGSLSSGERHLCNRESQMLTAFVQQGIAIVKWCTCANSIQFNSIRFNSTCANSIQFDSIRFNSTQFNTIQFHVQCASTQFSSLQQCISFNSSHLNSIEIQFNSIQLNSMPTNNQTHNQNKQTSKRTSKQANKQWPITQTKQTKNQPN